MGKSSAPKAKSEKCPKCGRSYINFCNVGKSTTRDICTICNPDIGKKENK